MTVFQAIILGIIQGIAEFLPISSSGHLVLFQKIFGINEPAMTFDVVLHIGTLVPVFIVFRKDILALLKNPFQKMTGFLIVGTLPAVVITLLLGDTIDMLFETGRFLPVGFFFTAIILLYAEKVSDGKKSEKDMSYIDALFVGCLQGVAIMPAISRSGSTIAASLFRKLNRETAAKFSFLLSIPAILGAAVLQVKDFVTGEAVIGDIPMLPFAAGFVASMLCGYLAIKFMLRVINANKLSIFSFYVTAVGVLILIDQFFTKIFF